MHSGEYGGKRPRGDRLPEDVRVPDALPADFDPDDPATWRTRSGEKSAADAEKDSSDSDYYESWMFEEARRDTGSGRYRPVFMLFGGMAIAAMLPVVPIVSSVSVFIFAVAVVIWRLAAAFREAERSHPELSARPFFSLRHISGLEWAMYGCLLASAAVLGYYHGLGAFALVSWIAVAIMLYRMFRTWSGKVLFTGVIIVALMVRAATA